MCRRALSGPAHEAIAVAAQTQLSPATKLALAQILQETSSLSEGALAAVATWPDDLRALAHFGTKAAGWGPADVAEAETFNTDHPGNAGWHFVDLPLGASGYPATDPSSTDPLRPFVLDGEIVHALRQCIAILESPTAPPNFTKRQAVRWIVHLVGDLHQPMHVTSGYYKTTLATFATKPSRIVRPDSDPLHVHTSDYRCWSKKPPCRLALRVVRAG